MRVAVLWTGGKDSALALHKARITGYEVTNLLTFVPENADFLAHPLSFMRYQARAMGIPHNKEIVKAPLEAAYENAIRSFAEKHKLDALVTGDMAQVDGQPNWIRQRGASCGIKVLTPLWGMDRRRIMEELISNGFRAVISCVKKERLSEEWLGREIDKETLGALQKISAINGLDICGENGEYHTLTIDGPVFKKSVDIGSYSKHESGPLSYIKPKDIKLRSKP